MKLKHFLQSFLETVAFGLKVNSVKKKKEKKAFQAASFNPYILSQRLQKESNSLNTRTHRNKAVAKNVG